MTEVRVAVRIRPPVRSGGPPLSIRGQYGQFAYDYVIEENATQEQLFLECIQPQVNKFLQGYSSTVLVYGAGGTGKTHTLEGGPRSSRQEGAVPRAMHAICKNLAAVPRHRYKLYVTYCALSAGVEAQMVDLLAPGSPAVSLKDGSATTAMARLLHYQVEQHEDIYEVLRQGRMTRSAAFTAAVSSPGQGAGGNRSSGRPLTGAAHLMLNIQLTGFSASGEQLATNLTFVELAAPEAKDMMGYPAAADSALTRSLSLSYASLTAVVSALKAGGSGAGGRPESPYRGQQPPHVPWRDSPLTRWLKGCLGGSASVLVIATVAPGPEAAADTLATLSYVNRLRSGPKSDGLIVTATWDAGDARAPGFDAVASQQELHSSLRPQPLQGSMQERERFGSPIQVRNSPTASASSSRPSGHSRYMPGPQRAPSIDTMTSYHTESRRPASAPRGSVALSSGAPSGGGAGGQGAVLGTSVASLRSSTTAATPSSRPGSYAVPPSQHSGHQQEAPHVPPAVQPLRTSDVLPSASRPASHVGSGAGQPPAPPSSRGPAPLSDLLESLQLGGAGGVAQQRPPTAQAQAFRSSSSTMGYGVSRASADTGDGLGMDRGGCSFGERLEATMNPAQRGAPLASVGGNSAVVAGNSALQEMLDTLSRQVEQLRAELGAERRETQALRAEVSRLEDADRAAASSTEVLTRQHRMEVAELRNQLDATRKQLETSEGAKQLLTRRVQQLQEQQTSVLEAQAESSVLEAQAKALQDSLESARANNSSLSGQLAEARQAVESLRHGSDTLRQERDKLQRQNHELSEKLQAQVRSLSEEMARLRGQALEAAGQVEAEQVARKAAEAALTQLRMQVDNSRGAEGSALQQAAQYSAQARELSAALEAVRAERNKLQEAKWRSDERAEQLALELDAALTARAKQEMEARAAATKAESDLRSAITAAEQLKLELTSARAQVDSAKQELRAAQLSAEDAARRESAANTHVQEMEALLRELDRDLEVQVTGLWRQLRAERADSLFGVPDAGSLGPSRRWRPVLQALVGIIKRTVIEAERQGQALEQARERASSLEAQVHHTNELATSLAAHQQVKAAQLQELEENRRSIALLDQALGEANRECQRLHRQLEELTAAHKAFTAEASAREARLQAQGAEREATLQAEVAEREERLHTAAAEHERRMQALASEWESRMQAAVSERDARLRNAVAEADARVHAAQADRDARLAAAAAAAEARLNAAVAEGEARLSKVVADRDARLQQAASDAEARLREVLTEREARVAALSAEREALQRQVTALAGAQADDRQERDVLRLKAQSRDQLLSILWSEVSAAKAAGNSGTGSAAAGSPHASPSGLLSVGASGLSALLEAEAGMDWADPTAQDRLLKAVTTVRVQLGKLQAEAASLRAGSAMSEDLSAQLVSCRVRLAEAQRSAELLQGRVATLEEQLSDAQHARSSLQQQLASSEAEAGAVQSSLAEARATIASLQDEVAMLSKSRDTWKDTATQQEAQLRELYVEGEARAGELSRLRGDAQAATTEASGAVARLKLLESQLQDAQGQIDTLSARLAATDKALSEANTRAASLNGQLVLADSEARLKTQELLARVQAAEDGEKLAKANAKEAMERLDGRLREAADQGAKLVADLDTLRAERNDAQLKADELQRQVLEAKARLVDSEHVAKQLHKVMGERDALQEQVNALRNAHSQASEDARNLRRQLDSAQEQIARLTEEKNRLAAQVEAHRLDAIMSSMAPRTGGRIVALAGASAAGGATPGVGAGLSVGLGVGGIPGTARPAGTAGAVGALGGAGLGLAGDGQRTAPTSYSRDYAGLAFPTVGPSISAAGYNASASPTMSRPGAPYGSLAAPYTPASVTGGVDMPGSRLGTGYGVGAEDYGSGVRVHVRASPPMQPPTGRPM